MIKPFGSPSYTDNYILKHLTEQAFFQQNNCYGKCQLTTTTTGCGDSLPS